MTEEKEVIHGGFEFPLFHEFELALAAYRLTILNVAAAEIRDPADDIEVAQKKVADAKEKEAQALTKLLGLARRGEGAEKANEQLRNQLART